MAVTIIGVGEAGVTALPASSLAIIAAADHIIAAPRFHADLPAGAAVADWPAPFNAVYAIIAEKRDCNFVILATGDPMWFGAGASLIREFGLDFFDVIPGVSGFQMAAARMGWAQDGCETLTIHGRPSAAVTARLYPRARLLIIPQDRTSPATVAALLCAHGYGDAAITVLGGIGGDNEMRVTALASAFDVQDLPDFHMIAVECPDAATHHSLLALPDSAFENDGKLTKRDARASALAKLAPFPGAVLWDVGSGSGAVAIDFLRSAPRGTAWAIDRNENQVAMATSNASLHGVTGLTAIKAEVPAGLEDLPRPDAVFIGGGLSQDTLRRCAEALRPGGVMVAHSVTLQSEAVLMRAWDELGGNLTRLSIHHADPVGAFHGWRPLMPVTQFCWTRPVGGDANG